jgi:hypothetical protein
MGAEMAPPDKPIVISTHAAERMRQRGAAIEEVESAVRSGQRKPGRRGKWQSRERFGFDDLSPVNARRYRYKTVEVIFAETPRAVVVVTVKVYYHN